MNDALIVELQALRLAPLEKCRDGANGEETHNVVWKITVIKPKVTQYNLLSQSEAGIPLKYPRQWSSGLITSSVRELTT